MKLEQTSVLAYGLARTAELMDQAFADYVVPVQITKATLLHMVRRDGIDAASSRVILRNGEAVGAALIARRGWSSRLAGMAILPEARGLGIGRWCMEHLMTEARTRGEQVMVLEVIEQNAAAVRLYLGCGFRTRRRLLGYAGQQLQAAAGNNLVETDMHCLGRLVTTHGLPDLPWQLSGESLALMGPPNRAYQLGAAYAAISNPAKAEIAIRSILVEPQARRRGQAVQLLRALTTKFPNKTWTVPPLCPEEIGGVFEKVGFVRGPLSQLQMETSLTQPPTGSSRDGTSNHQNQVESAQASMP